MRKKQKRRTMIYSGRRTAAKEDRWPVKTLLLILLLCLSLCIKAADSGPLYEFRMQLEKLTAQLEVQETVETLGRTFSADKDGDENAMLVFGRMILGLEEEPAEKEDASTGQATQRTKPEIHTVEYTMAGDLSGQSYEVFEAPLPRNDPEVLAAMAEAAALTEIDDGTINEAFHIPSPDIVDESLHKPSFSMENPLQNYRVTSQFGYRIHPISGNTTFHYGADLAAASGTKVCAVAAGTVNETGYGAINGNYIKIAHIDGYVSHYTHLQTITVRKGEKVSAGQKIGTVGSTGYSTGPHLHFELRKDGKVLNPFAYFSF